MSEHERKEMLIGVAMAILFLSLIGIACHYMERSGDMINRIEWHDSWHLIK